MVGFLIQDSALWANLDLLANLACLDPKENLLLAHPDLRDLLENLELVMTAARDNLVHLDHQGHQVLHQGPTDQVTL